MNKIKHSLWAKTQLLLFFLIVFLIIDLVTKHIKGVHMYYMETIVFIIVIIIIVPSFVREVGMNRAEVLLDRLSNRKRAIASGFRFKLPWETIEYKVDLEAVTLCTVEETFPTTDGSIKAKATVSAKPAFTGTTEITKSRHLVTYVGFKEEARQALLTAETKKHMREVFNKVTSDFAVLMRQEDILEVSDFSEVMDQLAMSVVRVQTFDIDLGPAVQQARNSKAKAAALAEVTQILKQEGGYTAKEAREVATLLEESIDNSKRILELKGIPEGILTKLVSVLEGISKKIN